MFYSFVWFTDEATGSLQFEQIAVQLVDSFILSPVKNHTGWMLFAPSDVCSVHVPGSGLYSHTNRDHHLRPYLFH